jgi:hypothetical protein
LEIRPTGRGPPPHFPLFHAELGRRIKRDDPAIVPTTIPRGWKEVPVRIHQVAVLIALAGLLVLNRPARAAEDSISFKKRGDAEKMFVTKVGTAIIKAARFKPQKLSLEKYNYENPKAGRTHLNIKMVYHGLVSRKRYVADIVVIIDSTNKDSWEVLNIKYDNNPSPTSPNERKIQELIKELNK